MNQETEVLTKALAKCASLLHDYPAFPPLLSTKVQLEYLIALVNGSSNDRSRLKDIIIGVYAAREFETIDMSFPNLVYEGDEIAERLKRTKSRPD